MGAYLASPNLEKVSEDGQNKRLRYGASAMQGWRLAQEDGHNCLPDFTATSELFGVYDGHGGPEVAVYCAKHLPDVIKSSATFKGGDMEKALVESFMNFDLTLKKDKVIQQLKEIAGIDNCSDAEEDEVDNLQEEAHLPLGELLNKFGMPSNKNQRSLRKKVQPEDLLSPVVTNKKRPVFPFLKDSHKKGEVVNGAEGNNDCGTGDLNGEGGETCEPEKETNNKEKDTNHQDKSEEEAPVSIDHSDSDSVDEGKPEVTKEEVICNGKNKEEKEDAKSHKENHNSDEAEQEDGEFPEDEEEEDDDEEEEDDEEELDEDDDGTIPPTSGREEPGSDSGTTACVALLNGNEVMVANIGDSRCVLSRGGGAVDLSVDHKPEDEGELQRIEAAGGKVTLDGRVNGGLNLSRAFGDHCYKTNGDLPPEEQMISPFPDIQRMTLTEQDQFMVIACDGIWNAMTSQEVVDFVKDKLDEDTNVTLSSICEELFDLCLAPDTSGDGTGCDNMTCIIVLFSPPDQDHKPNPGGKRKGTLNQGKADTAPQSKRHKV